MQHLQGCPALVYASMSAGPRRGKMEVWKLEGWVEAW